ncbi:MAG TPA: nucleoside-diphosphate sugar epimerase/dehydratase, partial [Allosphingosinicella sp.]|nr:nucleoside-diphosphate sugar epimerase/dehydratase [Allosphingosinicella sp.]
MSAWKRSFSQRLLSLSRRDKRLFALSLDTFICIWTVWAAFYLRLEEWVWLVGNHWLAVIAAPLLAVPIFIKGGLYRAIFRHAGRMALIAVVRACLVYGALYALIFTFIGIPGIPRTVGLIQPVLLFLTIGASRAFAHYLLSGDYQDASARQAVPNVLIYGAGSTGRQLALAVEQSRKMQVIGFLDDDRSLQGASVQGAMIHAPRQILSLVDRYEVSDVLLAVPSAPRRRRREILELLRPAGVNVRTLPGLLDLAQGRFQVSELRAVEIEDLLGRDAVAPDQGLLEKNIKDKVVLVTGGGGSIGAELCRQILELRPAALLIVDASEYALYTIHRALEVQQKAAGLDEVRLVPLLASVVDEGRMRSLLATWRPATIYHAAAYKHVPLVEHNVLEGLRNNVLGTHIVARLAGELGVENFVLISTDKAVRPTNVMGASKRLAELILQALAEEAPSLCYSMVRFGNVLGSSGSVVPLFRQQIGSGGPVTLTHPGVTRYFMTIPEAAQLVIQAGAMARGGDVFVLDMGDPVRILDLAQDMIRLSGLEPERD